MMNEDKLIELAFGELDATESTALTASISSDHSTLRQLEELTILREGLKDLRDVPELQLSNERLKDAILASSMTASQSSFWSKFQLPHWVLGATATASVLMMAFFVFRPGRTTEPQLIGLNPTQLETLTGRSSSASREGVSEPLVATNAPDRASEAFQSEEFRPSTIDVPGTVPDLNQSKSASVTTRPINRKSNSSRKKIKRESTAEAKRALEVMVAANNTKAEVSPAPMLSTMAAAAPVVSSDSASSIDANAIVIIKSEKDAGTGAQIATEVSNPVGLILGG